MKAIITVVCLLALILGACWLTLEIQAKSTYGKARDANYVTYAVTPMDQKAIAFLAEVQSNWRCWADTTNGPDSDVLKLVGKSPLVSNLIEIYNYRMPPFEWFSPSQNRTAVAVNLIKAKFMPVSADKQWHVSADGHIAFLLCKSNVVALYRDVPAGLRASYYTKKESPMAKAVIKK